MPAPYQVAVLMAAWCGLRFGEVAELRRKDIELEDGRLLGPPGRHLRRRHRHRRAPKSNAGTRDVAIPPHLLPAVRAHLVAIRPRAGTGCCSAPPVAPPDSGSAMHDAFHAARAKVGRPDLTFHDLSHTGAILAAATGATLAELMARLGHSTPAAAMRYQHASADRDLAIAAALSEFHLANVVDLRAATKKAR